MRMSRRGCKAVAPRQPQGNRRFARLRAGPGLGWRDGAGAEGWGPPLRAPSSRIGAGGSPLTRLRTGPEARGLPLRAPLNWTGRGPRTGGGLLVRPQELAKQADSPETDSHCPDCQTWAQKGNCGIERHPPFGRRGARSPCERLTCDHGGRRVQDTWREARQTEEAQAHAQEQRSRLRARNRLDLPRVRERRGRPRTLARALG